MKVLRKIVESEFILAKHKFFLIDLCLQNDSRPKYFLFKKEKSSSFLVKYLTFSKNFEKNRIYNIVVFLAGNGCSILFLLKNFSKCAFYGQKLSSDIPKNPQIRLHW